MAGLLDPSNLEVDFSSIAVDVLEQMRGRLLYYFGNSPVIDQILQSLSCEVQELIDATQDVIKLRTLFEARGVQLDVIGRIVGQDRVILNADQRTWFGPDSTNPIILRPDALGSVAFVDGADLTGDVPATDSEYLNLIISKIFKNHVQGGSLPEVQIFIKLLTGYDVSFLKKGLQELALLVRVDTPPNVVETITTITTDGRDANEKYLIPLPAGDRIVEVGYVPLDSFRPDRRLGRPDFAKSAIFVIL